MKNGFVSIGIILAVVITTLVTAGGGYGVYKVKALKAENERIRTELEAQEKGNSITTEASSTDSGNEDLAIPVTDQPTQGSEGAVAKTTNTTQGSQATYEALKKQQQDTYKEIETVVDRCLNIEGLQSSVPSGFSEHSGVCTVTPSAESEDIEEEEPAYESPVFDIKAVRQTFFEDESEDYGGFEIDLSVTARGEENILIPQSTSDTANTGAIGFSYSVLGNFAGIQDSEIACAVRTGSYCKIRGGGTSDITVTVWLFPEDPGNYSVRFDEVTYFHEITETQYGEEEVIDLLRGEYELDKKTGTIFVY